MVIGPQRADRHVFLEGWVHEELVRQAQKGDAEAFDALARMVGDRCLGIAVRILRDLHLAEDAVQAALITAWSELRTLRDPSRSSRGFIASSPMRAMPRPGVARGGPRA